MSDDYSFKESPFAERFTLLLESNQISSNTLQLVMKIIDQVEKDLEITLTEDNADMFVSHLALALQRIADGQAIKQAPSVLLSEAHSVPEYWQMAGGLIQIAEESLHTDIETSERAYLTLHLVKLAIGAGR